MSKKLRYLGVIVILLGVLSACGEKSEFNKGNVISKELMDMVLTSYSLEY